MFKKNEHNVERVIRVVFGLALISQAFVGQQNMWFLLGIVPVVTGLWGVCPVYTLLGVNTCGCSDKGACCSTEKKA